MVFGSTELARRIEAAECGLLEECTAAVARRAGRGEAFSLTLAGGVAAFSGPDSPLTKLAGLGFTGLPPVAELERIEALFAERKAVVQVELSNLAVSGIAEMLTRRGYVLAGFENVLGRPLDARTAAAERAGITVERSGEAELDPWIDLIVSAFSALDPAGVASHESFQRDSAERIMRDMAATSCVRYLARRGDSMAGGASMRIAAGVAQLCGAGTLPEHRRRGVQAALLERRLADAARAGCDIAVVTTLPGSKSQENVQKQGFELLYTRAILRRGV